MDSTRQGGLKNVWKENRSKDPKGSKWKIPERSREHVRKEEPKRAPVVPNRRALKKLIS
jgi:hypothetical protein